MEEKKQEDFGNDGVDEFFGDDVEQEGAQPSTMADRCVLQTFEHLKSHQQYSGTAIRYHAFHTRRHIFVMMKAWILHQCQQSYFAY